MGPAQHPASSPGAHAFYAAVLFLVLFVVRTDCRLRRGRTFLARSRQLQWSAATGWAGEQQPGGNRTQPKFPLADAFGAAPASAWIPLAAVPLAFQPSPAPAGVAPAPAPAVVAPAPAPLPPAKFPVIGDEECQVLQEAIVVEPKASCRHVVFSAVERLDGCTCSIVLPASINPMPNNLYDPWAIDVAPDPDLPLPPTPPTVPPPSNPMQPYIAPMMAPECPFAKSCAKPDDFGCVGYNSFGFSEAHMAPYSPAASHLNQISCSYFMALRSTFQIPSKVGTFAMILAKRKQVEEDYEKPFVIPQVLDGFGGKGEPMKGIPCAGKEIEKTWREFCFNRVSEKNWPCSIKYTAIMESEKCVGAPAPTGFLISSTLKEMCPLECGFTRGHTMWPPLPANVSGAAVWKPWGI